MAEEKKFTMGREEIQNMFARMREGGDQTPLGTAKVLDDGQVELVGTTIKAIRKEVLQDFKPDATKIIAQITESEYNKLDEKHGKRVDDALAEYQRQIAENAPVQVVIEGKKGKKIEGTVHKRFATLLKVVSTGQSPLLVGPAGTGKTYAAEKVAEALDFEFYSISVGAQTSKSDLQGYMNVNGNYVETAFRRAYEHGGVFLLDEADAGNSNVLILLNAALSNGYMAFPDKMVQAHADFRLIASANTYGTGASRQYVGRNQLDAATLDRFTTIDWEIDDKVEQALSGGNLKWLKVVKNVRDFVAREQIRAVISPRATKRGAELLSVGLSIEEVLDMALLSHINDQYKGDLTKASLEIYNG